MAELKVFCRIKKRKLYHRLLHRIIELLKSDRAGIRTQDPQLRRLLLYPAELPDHPHFGGAKVGIFLLKANFSDGFFLISPRNGLRRGILRQNGVRNSP